MKKVIEDCIDQWEKIVANLPDGFDGLNNGEKPRIILDLKYRFRIREFALCAFCDDANYYCKECVGVKIDPSFHCSNVEYCYATKPRLFLRELKRLNELRKDRYRRKTRR